MIGGQVPAADHPHEQAAALDAIASRGRAGQPASGTADATRNCWACDIHLTDGLPAW